jgi:diguanylate cyclase (GGDEF)-like protein
MNAPSQEPDERRKLFRRTVDEQLDYIQSVVDALSEPITIINEQYQLICLNKAAQELMPDSNGTSKPLICYRCLHGKDVPCTESDCSCPRKRAKETGKPVTVVHEHSLPNKEVRSFEIVATPLWGRDGAFQGIVESFRDITERKKLEEEIWHMAYHDSLTGLPNRRLFRELIRFELEEAYRNLKKMGLLFLDLDRFKGVNDTLGHEAGDELLKTVAERLKSAVRKADAIARIGGDEFSILLAGITGPKDITEIVRKIMVALRDKCVIAGREFHITTSMGISIYPDDSDDINTLFRYADIALYRAKNRGRNTFAFYNSDRPQL